MEDEITYKLLKALEENPKQSQRELSKTLGISLGKTNYCLNALIARGFVKAGNFRNNPRKSRYFYLLTSQGVDAKTRVALRFLRLKMREYDRLKKEIAQLRRETSRS